MSCINKSYTWSSEDECGLFHYDSLDSLKFMSLLYDLREKDKVD